LPARGGCDREKGNGGGGGERENRTAYRSSSRVDSAEHFPGSYFFSRFLFLSLDSPVLDRNSGYPPSPLESWESAGSHEIPGKIRMAKKLDIKIRETKDLEADSLDFARLSRPEP
jgi:hypothetical protein